LFRESFFENLSVKVCDLSHVERRLAVKQRRSLLGYPDLREDGAPSRFEGAVDGRDRESAFVLSGCQRRTMMWRRETSAPDLGR
jgi:hypothetical protein